VDIVVRGEAENTVVDLAGCIKKRDSLKTVKGISFRSGREVVSTPKRPLIKDLDSLPFPNRKLVDSEYHCMVAGANVAPKKFTGIVSSRGCVHGCRFCSCTQFAENIWRPRSVGNTLEEMLLLKGEGYKQFMLVDDSFTLNPKRVIELCRGMRREKMDMEWICEGRVDNCPSEMLREMVAAGCKILYFGIESANQRILNYYNKRTTPQQSEDAVKKARRSGMDVIIGSFILGAPDETMEEILNTIEFAKKIPIDLPQFNILGAQPGNDLWEELVAKRFINEEEYWETGIEVSKLSLSSVSYDEIRRTVHEAFYRFVSRPSFLLKQTARTLRSNYRRNVIINSLGSLGEIREKARYVA
ncbi:radical SAM protein, partial [Candidatus Bathyarchaeota archaeon]|nr:radical SAM protein [Candidatus Bathyarchaeota archaeon]